MDALKKLLPLTPLWYNILLAITDEPRHGYAIIKEIESRTRGDLVPATGTVYLALQRLLEEGLIGEVPAEPDKDRRRRRYGLTPLGRDVVAAEARRLAEQVRMAVDKGAAPQSVFEPS